jgi:Arc/MetJ-type ribon-helix-helix transcriptional regulator
MGAIQLPDELQRAIDRQVDQGRASSALAFLQEAVSRLIDDAQAEEDDIESAVQAGLADAEAGRYIIVSSAEDGRHLHARLMAKVLEGLAIEK